MLINPKIYDAFTLELNNPLTEEQWDILDDVDFDHTEHIWFHTKHGKEVHFYKNAIPIEWLNKRAEEIAFAYWTNARNKVTLPLNELPLLIDQIIGEWEKENGK